MSFVQPYDMVEIGNRTSKPLTVTYDAKTWVLPPYPEVVSVPRIVADIACRQHPRMGTEDPYNPRVFEKLVYVKGWKNMPDTPIEQSATVERLDRTKLPPDRRKTVLRENPYKPMRDSEEPLNEAHFDGR